MMRLRLEEQEESNPSGMTGIEWYCEEDSSWHLFSMCTSLSFAQTTLEAFEAFNLLNSLTEETNQEVNQEVKSDEEVDTGSSESSKEPIDETKTEESDKEENKEVELVLSSFTLSEQILEAAVQGH